MAANALGIERRSQRFVKATGILPAGATRGEAVKAMQPSARLKKQDEAYTISGEMAAGLTNQWPEPNERGDVRNLHTGQMLPPPSQQDLRALHSDEVSTGLRSQIIGMRILISNITSDAQQREIAPIVQAARDEIAYHESIGAISTALAAALWILLPQPPQGQPSHAGGNDL